MGEIFERTKPATALEWTGERFTSGVVGQIEIEHLHRYFLARELCRGLDVVDVASGEGYGSALLAQTARSVVGVDVSDAAVQHARQAYIGENLQYIQGDARRIPLEDNSVDVAVSFETIEHFYDHGAFLTEIRRILRPGGRFIVSSPERDVYSPSGSPANEYHVRELSGAEFYALLRQTFDHVRMLAQRPMIGSALFSDQGSDSTTTFEKRGSHHFEACSGLPRPLYLVAIASDHHVFDIPNSVYIESDEIEVALSAAGSIAGIIAENATLKACAEAAETARASAAALLDRAVAEAGQQADAHRAQMLELDRASHAHALRASMLEDQLTESIAKLETVQAEAGQQADAHRAQMLELDRASHAHALRVSMLEDQLTESIAKLETMQAEAGQQADAHRAQMLELDRASHAHALRASMLEDQLTESIAKLETVQAEAGQQADAHRAQMLELDRASHAHALRVSMLEDQLTESIAKLETMQAEAGQQADAHRAQMLELDRASHAHAFRASMLQDQLTESIAKLETVQSAHSKAVLEFRGELEAARQETVIARTDAELAQSEAAAARQQRDLARVGALRAASKAEGAWRFKLEELERQAADTEGAWRFKLEELERQAADMAETFQAKMAEAESLRLAETEILLQKVANAEQQAAEWRFHYERLRAKLDIVLRRFLIYRLSRLIPKPLRRFAREKLLRGESR